MTRWMLAYLVPIFALVAVATQIGPLGILVVVSAWAVWLVAHIAAALHPHDVTLAEAMNDEEV